MDSHTTVMLRTPNCSSLFPPSSNTQVATHISECLEDITSNSTSAKLNSSSSRGKTALAVTCQSLSRISQYCLCHGRGRNPQRWTVLRPQHHCCGPILQIWPQDTGFPHKRRDTTPGSNAVISHLDYWNPLLAGLPTFVTKPLQCI